MIYMFLSNNPSSGDINSSNLPCLKLYSCFGNMKCQSQGWISFLSSKAKYKYLCFFIKMSLISKRFIHALATRILEKQCCA